MRMLSKHHSIQRDQLELITLDQLVPANHLVRKMEASIDFTFIYDLVKDMYSEVGRPSIDPVILVKLIPNPISLQTGAFILKAPLIPVIHLALTARPFTNGNRFFSVVSTCVISPSCTVIKTDPYCRSSKLEMICLIFNSSFFSIISPLHYW